MTDPSPRDARAAYADSLDEFEEQRAWYSARAGQFKARARWIDMLIIVAGALIAALPPLRATLGDRIDYLFAALGLAIVVAQGMQRIYRYSEIWPEYRLASERMKRERRLFVHAAGPYPPDDTAAGALYVERLETILADEQKIFFDTQRATAKQDIGIAS